MRDKTHRGLTSYVLPIFVQDTSAVRGEGLSGLTHTSGITAEYRREGQNTWTSFTLKAGTLGTWDGGGGSYGWVADGADPGSYEVSIPDAAVTSGTSRWVLVRFRGATNMLTNRNVIMLDAVDYQSATDFVSSVPSVVGAIGGFNATAQDEILFQAGQALLDYDTGGGVAKQTDTGSILNRIGGFAGSGVNNILGVLRAIMRKDATLPSDVGGSYAVATDSLEAQQEADLTQAGVQAALTAQGYTPARAGYLDTLNGLVAAIVDAIKADVEWQTMLANAEGEWTLTKPVSYPGTGSLVLKSKDGLTTFVTFTLAFDSDKVVTSRTSV